MIKSIVLRTLENVTLYFLRERKMLCHGVLCMKKSFCNFLKFACLRLVNKSFQVLRILPSDSEVLNCKN